MEELWAELKRQLQDRLVELFEATALNPFERGAAGRCLGYLGDPRRGVAPDWPPSDARPFFAWGNRIEPDSTFVMGEDSDSLNGKEPFSCPIEAPYWPAKYPVTNAQYDHFEESKYFKQHQLTPRNKNDPKFVIPNHPVVYVSWHDAMHFCKWINEELDKGPDKGGITLDGLGLPATEGGAGEKWRIHLPTEAQWERAARHNDKRFLPWADNDVKLKEPLENHCNNRTTGIGGTSAVGLFPSGGAPCGCLDLIGNVWEWCRTRFTDVPLPYVEQLVADLGSNDARVVRGGSWSNCDPVDLRAAFRHRLGPGARDDVYGFRVVCVGESG